MASETVTLTSICAGGNHLTFTLTGAKEAAHVLELSSISEPLTDAEIEGFLKCVAKLARQGRTLAQARTLLQAGVTVTV